MEGRYCRHYSSCLQRDMEYKIFGDSGRPLLVFPSQSGRFYDFEDNGMIAAVDGFIRNEKIQVFCADSNDEKSFSLQNADPRRRIEAQEAYYRYIVEELIPALPPAPLAVGCSMGAYHAFNMALRRPELFSGAVGLSGAYDLRLFFGDYMDDLVYANSPLDYLRNMPVDHPYVSLYQKREWILCCGRGDWEHPMQEDGGRMQACFNRLGVPAWIDFWGPDVSHDWSWWRKQLPYYLSFLC